MVPTSLAMRAKEYLGCRKYVAMCQILTVNRHTTIVTRTAVADTRVGRRSPMCEMATPNSIAIGTSTTTKYLEGW